MEIKTRNQLRFCILADHMMNFGCFHPSLSQRVKMFLMSDRRMAFLSAMRHIQFYTCNQGSYWQRALLTYYKIRYHRLGVRLGFSISATACDYGLRLPHYGTIVVGECSMGPYGVLLTSTCIASKNSNFGAAFHLSAGAVVTQKVEIGDAVIVAANSVVNRSFPQGHCLLAGAPAIKKSDSGPWYFTTSQEHVDRYQKVELLKKQMGL